MDRDKVKQLILECMKEPFSAMEGKLDALASRIDRLEARLESRPPAKAKVHFAEQPAELTRQHKENENTSSKAERDEERAVAAAAAAAAQREKREREENERKVAQAAVAAATALEQERRIQARREQEEELARQRKVREEAERRQREEEERAEVERANRELERQRQVHASLDNIFAGSRTAQGDAGGRAFRAPLFKDTGLDAMGSSRSSLFDGDDDDDIKSSLPSPVQLNERGSCGSASNKGSLFGGTSGGASEGKGSVFDDVAAIITCPKVQKGRGGRTGGSSSGGLFGDDDDDDNDDNNGGRKDIVGSLKNRSSSSSSASEMDEMKDVEDFISSLSEERSRSAAHGAIAISTTTVDAAAPPAHAAHTVHVEVKPSDFPTIFVPASGGAGGDARTMDMDASLLTEVSL